MQRRSFIAAAVIVLTISGGGSPVALAQFDPVALLGRTLGMSKDQMEGGLGSILSLAQEKLARGDFDKVAAAIPGASNYLEQAKKLGAVTGPLKDVSGLTSALGRLGIDQQTVSQFLPAAQKLVGQLGGEEVGKLLGSVLGT